MMLGRVPVIVSDQWVPPDGPDWESFSMRVKEREVDTIPAMLEAAQLTHRPWVAPPEQHGSTGSPRVRRSTERSTGVSTLRASRQRARDSDDTRHTHRCCGHTTPHMQLRRGSDMEPLRESGRPGHERSADTAVTEAALPQLACAELDLGLTWASEGGSVPASEYFHARIALSRALRLPMPRSVTAQLAPDGHEVLISTPGELSVLHDIMVHREYEPRGAPRVIFDLGANVGFASLFFWRRYPDARVIAVEADPVTYGRLVRNVGHLPRVTTLHRAVAGSDGPVRFFPSVESIGSSLIAVPGSSPAVEVAGASIESLMRESDVDRIDFLKIDIEGAEFDALRTAPLDRVEELIAEFHYDLAGGDEQSVRELFAGFEVVLEPLPQANRQLARARRIATHGPSLRTLRRGGGRSRWNRRLCPVSFDAVPMPQSTRPLRDQAHGLATRQRLTLVQCRVNESWRSGRTRSAAMRPSRSRRDRHSRLHGADHASFSYVH